MTAARSPDERARIQQLLDQIAVGLRQFDRGQYAEYDEASLKERFERIKSAGRQRLASDEQNS